MPINSIVWSFLIVLLAEEWDRKKDMKNIKGNEWSCSFGTFFFFVKTNSLQQFVEIFNKSKNSVYKIKSFLWVCFCLALTYTYVSHFEMNTDKDDIQKGLNLWSQSSSEFQLLSSMVIKWIIMRPDLILQLFLPKLLSKSHGH